MYTLYVAKLAIYMLLEIKPYIELYYLGREIFQKKKNLKLKKNITFLLLTKIVSIEVEEIS